MLDFGLARRVWRQRAEQAEAENARLQQALVEAQEHLNGIEQRFRNRAALVSITVKGRINRFMFSRAGKLIVIETYSTLEDDVTGWKHDLLDNIE